MILFWSSKVPSIASLNWAYSKMVLRFHGMEEVGVRFSLGPPSYPPLEITIGDIMNHMSIQSRHFIIWLVALTILVVVIAVTLKVMNNGPKLDPQGTDILNAI